MDDELPAVIYEMTVFNSVVPTNLEIKAVETFVKSIFTKKSNETFNSDLNQIKSWVFQKKCIAVTHLS